MPVIAQRYPSYRKTLLRASRNFAEAAQLLDELAAADAQSLTASGLSIAALRRLSTPRAKNVIRYFLAAQGITMPNAARLDECVRQLLPQRATRATIDLGDHELRRYANELRVVAKIMTPPRDFCRTWRGESRLRLPELGGTLVLKKSRGAGISLDKLTAQPVTVRLRQGGERIQPHPQRPRRSLKNLLQEARVPPWLRDRLPLLFCGDELLGLELRAGHRHRCRRVSAQPDASRVGSSPTADAWEAADRASARSSAWLKPFGAKRLYNKALSWYSYKLALKFRHKGSCMAVERTLSIIKPDAVAKNVIGQILARFEQAGLKIIAARMLHLSRQDAEGFYAVHRARPFFKDLVDFMTSGPVMVQVLEGENAIQKNRDLMGATDPKKAAKGTIRADFAQSIDANAVHGSDGPDTAKLEIAYFFPTLNIYSR